MMAKSKTNEQALESSIEKTLTGTTQEELKEHGIVAETMPDYGINKMFYVGFNSDFSKEFLTGFDQPKLTSMYVDKKLQGVMAVQALSRLNRSADKLGKKTEDLFILDFFNSVEDIKASFDPFYTATTLSAATDVNVLHELKENLDSH